MYKYIVFDVDGTLIDTELAVLQSLKETLKIVLHKDFDISELNFALGITGYKALQQLNVENIEKTLVLWNDKMRSYKNLVRVFDGIEKLLSKLSNKYKLGIVTSKTKEEFEKEFSYFGLDSYFRIVVCADDTNEHKPSPEPLLKFMELTNIDSNNLVYIGDSVYDMNCAESAKVDFIFAKWGNKRDKLNSIYSVETPNELERYLI